jgi:hypothetical protein
MIFIMLSVITQGKSNFYDEQEQKAKACYFACCRLSINQKVLIMNLSKKIQDIDFCIPQHNNISLTTIAGKNI